jgi:hypothetical protein
MDFVITLKKLFITQNYVLLILASFENKTKSNIITGHFQLNETGKTTIQRVFLTIETPAFTSWIRIRQVVFPVEFRFTRKILVIQA